MANLLKLHEAIGVVLLSKTKRTASTEKIADEINPRGLYKRKDGKPIPAYQVMMRTKLAKGQYHNLFQFKEPDVVFLK